MMRQPTPVDIAYRWHRDAMGPRALPPEDEPQCGWFKVKLSRHAGWLSPARIFLEALNDPETNELLEDEILCCEILGKRQDPHRWWERLREHPISEAEFNYLTTLAVWCAWHQPNHPAANPRDPVDWLTCPVPSFAGAKHGRGQVQRPVVRHRQMGGKLGCHRHRRKGQVVGG